MYNSPEKKRLRERIGYLQADFSKKLKAANRVARDQTSKLLKLREVLDDVVKNKLISAEVGEKLGLIGMPCAELLEQLFKKTQKEPLPKEYPPRLRSFAVTVHYYSPRAYEFVREPFLNVLPHPKTISAWYRSMNGIPEFFPNLSMP